MPRRAERKTSTSTPQGDMVVVTTRVPTAVYNRAFDEAEKRGSTVGREVERIIRNADDLTAIFSPGTQAKLQHFNRVFAVALETTELTGDSAAYVSMMHKMIGDLWAGCPIKDQATRDAAFVRLMKVFDMDAPDMQAAFRRFGGAA